MKLNNLSPDKIKKLSLNDTYKLSKSIRDFLIETNSITGGHIGANLGVVELSIAMHRVFNSPKDSFFFDTGHIGYTHKIITGRAKLFNTLNNYKGLNRFLTPDESKHDKIEASHAGTAISTALGNAICEKLNSSKNLTVAVVGDGALCEGISLEALNHASKEKVNLLIIINDNGYAISKGFGAINDILSSRKNNSKQFFNLLGYKTIGPIDGHNLRELENTFKNYIKNKGVQLIHIKTNKGQGYKHADESSNKMHFSMPFYKNTGKLKNNSAGKSIQNFATDIIESYMHKNKKILCITPSTRYATDLDRIFDKFKDRCFDPGMTEQHALSLANGFAIKGYLPVVFYQSTFLQRSFDQLIHDVSFANKNVLILSVRSGFAGYDNATHHGIYDISYLKGIPNLKIIYPENIKSMQKYISDYFKKPSGPTCILFPYGFEKDYLFKSENLNKIKKNNSAIITLGNTLGHCLDIQKELRNSGIQINIFTIERIKPLNKNKLLNISNKFKNLFLIEENVKTGGLNESLAKIFIDNKDLNFHSFSLKDKFYPGGSKQELYDTFNFSVKFLSNKIKKCLNH